MSTNAYHQALELERLGFYSDALNLFDQCLCDRTLSRGDVLFHIGWCLEQKDGSDSDAARKAYEQSIECLPRTVAKIHAEFRAAWVLMHQNDHARAAELFKRAVDEGGDIDGAEKIVQHAMFWLGVCLEADGRYLEAISWYRKVRTIAPTLDPEARLRELYCCISIADFEAAVMLSRTFEQHCPQDFSPARYRELAARAAKEGEMLERCLSPGIFLMN